MNYRIFVDRIKWLNLGLACLLASIQVNIKQAATFGIYSWAHFLYGKKQWLIFCYCQCECISKWEFNISLVLVSAKRALAGDSCQGSQQSEYIINELFLFLELRNHKYIGLSDIFICSDFTSRNFPLFPRELSQQLAHSTINF